MAARQPSAKQVASLMKTINSGIAFKQAPRVAAFGRQRIVPTVALVVPAGSRYESESIQGSSFFLEHLINLQIPTNGWSSYVKALEAVGAERLRVTRDRENLIYAVDVTEKSVPQAVQLLSAVASGLYVDHYHVDYVRENLQRIVSELTQEQVLDDALHREAFRGQSLGNALYPPHAIEGVTFESVNTLKANSFLSATSLVGLGVSESALKEGVSKNIQNPFDEPVALSGDYLLEDDEDQADVILEDDYVGGEVRIPSSVDKSHVIVAYEGQKAGSDQALSLGVIAELLGAFQRPRNYNPGFGAAGRLAQLASHETVRQAHVYSRLYRDTGLFGVSVSVKGAPSSDLGQAIHSIVSSFEKEVSNEDVERGKNLLATRLLSLDSTDTLLQFLAKEATQQGNNRVRSPEQYADALRSVTVESVRAEAKRLLASKPTLAAIGDIHTLQSIR